MHGAIAFSLQRYKEKRGDRKADFFTLNNLFMENLRTNKLNNYLFKYVNLLSYRHLAENIAEVMHLDITAAGLERAAIIEAKTLSVKNVAAIATTASQAAVTIAPACDIDLYAPIECGVNEEVNLFYDGICVKKQCPFRKDNPLYTELLPTKEKLLKRVNTNVAVLQLPDNQFVKLTEGLPSKGNIGHTTIELVEHMLKVHYPDTSLNTPLRLVAITDGASNIRSDFNTTLSPSICIILDWYHLVKKVRELMSMIATNKTEKDIHVKWINGRLWNGKTDDVLLYLQTISVKNKLFLDKLVTYLSKHALEIIDYERRKKVGRTIGSGRGEKANDQLIARRQKKKGLAWSDYGSKALAIIATVYA